MQGLYDSQFEHDACGVGFAVQMEGKMRHRLTGENGPILLRLDHRSAVVMETKSGDGKRISKSWTMDFRPKQHNTKRKEVREKNN